MLVNNYECTYYGKQTSSEEKIAKAERRLQFKKMALEDMQNEYNLIEEQTFNTYKSNINYLILGSREVIKKAKDWVNMLKQNTDKDGNKLDKRKHYDQKDSYNFYVDYVNNLLGIEMEDISFVTFNFSEAEEIRFTYKGHTWELYIPYVQNISLKSFRDCGGDVFKLRLSHCKKVGYWEMFASTYEEDALKELFQTGINKYLV